MTKQQKSLWAKLPQWAWKQGLRNNVDFTLNPDSSSANPERNQPTDCSDIKQAQVITSRLEYPQVTGDHKPILDIDFPAQCVPSTTPGHFHLYLDKEISWGKYRKLLKALAEAGIIEEGYYRASAARGYTAVRLPWVRKEPQAAAPAPEATEPANAPENGTQARQQAFGPAPANHQPASHGPDLGNQHYDRVIQNIEEATRQRGRDLGDRLLQQAVVDAANAATEGVNRIPNPTPSRGQQVRYNPVYMRYEDGTSYVSAIAMQRHGSPSLPNLIEQGAVVQNSIGWEQLVREHGHPLPQRRSRTIHREDVVFDDEPAILPEAEGVREAPMVQGMIRYNDRSHTFRITGAHAEGEEPREMNISETFYRERIMGGASIPTGLGSRLNRMGFEGRPIRRLFDAAYRPSRSIRGVLPADTPSDAQIERNRAEVSAHYTRLPDPIQPAVPTGRWTAEGSDPLGDVIAARDRIMNAPAYAPYTYIEPAQPITVSWEEPPSEPPAVDPLPF